MYGIKLNQVSESVQVQTGLSVNIQRKQTATLFWRLAFVIFAALFTSKRNFWNERSTKILDCLTWRKKLQCSCRNRSHHHLRDETYELHLEKFSGTSEAPHSKKPLITISGHLLFGMLHFFADVLQRQEFETILSVCCFQKFVFEKITSEELCSNTKCRKHEKGS